MDNIDPSQVQIDPTPTPTIDPNQVVHDEIQPSQVVLDENNPDYNTIGQRTLGTAEQIAQGIGGPFATVAEKGLSALGVPGLSDQEQESRKQALGPWVSAAAQATGIGASLVSGVGVLPVAGKLAESYLAGKGLLEPAAEGLMKYGQNIFKAMAEMGAYGAGEEINDQIKGKSQPKTTEDAVASVISHAGASMLLGGATAGLFTAGASAASSTLKKFAKTDIGIKAQEFLKDLGAAIAPAVDDFGNASSEQVIPEASEPRFGTQNTSLEDLKNRFATAAETPSETPSKAAILSATSRVAMDNPVHPLQLDALNGGTENEQYQLLKESPEGEILRKHEQAQKNELNTKLDQATKDIAGTPKVTANKIEGGEQASQYFTDQYQTEKKEAGALVGQARALDSEGFDHLTGMVTTMAKAVPAIRNMIDASGGTIEVLPYKTSMGISKQTYKAVKDAIFSLQDNPTKFSDLFNIRQGLENDVNMFTSDAQTQSQIRTLKASLMDYMQEIATPDLREGFKRYAINEQQREVIEKAFKASVGNTEYGAISKVVPENIINKIFANSSTVKAAQNILPEEQYNHLLGNWIAQAKAAATDTETGFFSSRKFATWIKTNTPELETAFKNNPKGLQQIKDLTTIMKILPDAPPVSPATYDKKIWESLASSRNTVDLLGNLAKYLKQATLGSVQKQKNIREINKLLAPVEDVEGVQELPKRVTEGLAKRIGRKIPDFAIDMASKAMSTNPGGLADALDHADMIKAGNNAMQTGVNSLFTGSQIAIEKKDSPTKEKIKKFIKNGTLNDQIENTLKQTKPNVPHFADGGEVLSTSEKMDPLNRSPLDILSTIVPDHTALMATAKGRVVNYLNSIRPIDSQPALPFDEKQTDPQQERVYDRALTIADKPLSVLKNIQDGTLTAEHMQHLTNMWPEVHNSLSKKIVQRMTNDQIREEKKPPYHVRQGLSLFLGNALDSNMHPQNIQAAQAVFASQKAAQQAIPQGKPKRNTSKIGEIAKAYQTGSQAAAARQITQK